MKNNQESKKTLSLSARILAGVMALLMLAGTVFGTIMYFL